MPRKFTLFLLFIVWLGASLPDRVARGHADYDHSDPAADAVLAVAPVQVRIWFTQEIFRRQGMNQIEVYDATGQRVDRNDTAIDDDDRTLMMVSLTPALPAGRYLVRWQALSAEDGHEGKGEFTFTVGEAGVAATIATSTTLSATTNLTKETAAQATVTPTSAPEPAATTAAASPAAPSGGLPCLGGAAPLFMIVGALLVARRRSGW